MGTLRSYFSLTYAVSCLTVGLVLYAAFVLYITHGQAHANKVELKFIAANLQETLNQHAGTTIDASVWSEVDQSLRWADREGRVTLFVLTPDGDLLHRRGDDLPTPEWQPLPAGETYEFSWHIRSLEHWDYQLLYKAGDTRYILHKRGHHETLEDLLIGGALYILLLLALSLIFGLRLAKKMVVPIEAISTSASTIRQGKLSTRIVMPQTHNELRKLADNLNRTFDELEQLVNQASDFSASAAHELRTPLTALRGKLDVALRKDRAATEYQDVMAECIDDIAQLQKIIDALLLITRPAAEYREQAFEIVNLGDCLSGVVDQISPLAADRGIAIDVNIQDEPMQLNGMPTFLSRLIANLVQNAIKFSPDQATVQTALRRDGDTIQLVITDHGIGMTDEQQSHIFERFYQADSSRHKGFGLGLSLVQWIADLHNATIDVKSKPDHGTTFTISFRAHA